MEDQTIETPPAGGEALTRAEINAEIRSIGRTANMPQSWIDRQIDAEATPDEARRAALAELNTRRAAPVTRTARAEVGFSHEAPQVRAERMAEGYLARFDPAAQVGEPARPYYGATTIDLGRECCRAAGISTTGLSADALFARAMTTSDFPLFLGGIADKEARRGYAAAESGARRLVRVTTKPNFRTQYTLIAGEHPPLVLKPEAAEYQFGALDEQAETGQIKTYGLILRATREMFVNDDLGMLRDLSFKGGVSARETENTLAVQAIEGNPNLSDGAAVFGTGASRGNAKSATATSETVSAHEAKKTDLAAARLAMWTRKGISGTLPIQNTPRYVLCHPKLETLMQEVLAQVQANRSEDVNPFSTLTLYVEPRLTDEDKWYVVSDPATSAGLELAYLAGSPGPQFDTHPNFLTDTVDTKVRLDVGVWWIDWRSWFRVG